MKHARWQDYDCIYSMSWTRKQKGPKEVRYATANRNWHGNDAEVVIDTADVMRSPWRQDEKDGATSMIELVREANMVEATVRSRG